MKNLTFLIALFVWINVNAQWTNETDVNTLVADSETGDMQAVGTSDGQTYVVFWKTVPSPTNYELRLQVLDTDGNRKLGDEGMLISDDIPMSTYTVTWSIAIDNDDNLFVGVTGTSDFSGHVFKMNKSGEQLWGSNGVSFSNAFKITLLPLSDGGAIVSWMPGAQALMQKYDADGNEVWASPVSVVSGSGKTAPGNMFELSNGDFIMIFHTYNYGINSTLYAQKYNSDGVEQWTSPVKLSDKTTVYNRFYYGTQDVDTIYFGYSASSSNRFDSFLQRINPDGTLPWGINGSDFDLSQNYFENGTRIAYTPGSQYVWSICTYSDFNQSKFGEYVQKFNKVTGERQFSDNAKMIYEINTESKVHASALYLVNDQPFFLLESGFDNGETPTELDVVLLDKDGDFAWDEGAKPVATYEANKKRTHLTKPVNGQSVALFIEDKSTGLKIYAQNFIFPPEKPELVSPENESLNIPIQTDFIWKSVDGALSYRIQISDDEQFANIITDDSLLVDTTFNFLLPEYDTIYFWRVMACNNTGNSEWSEVWNFTTEPVTGVAGLNSNNELNVFPNPAKDYVNFVFNNVQSDNDLHIVLYNLTGQVVSSLKSSPAKGKNVVRINIEKYPAGIYYYHISSSKLNKSGSFVKVK